MHISRANIITVGRNVLQRESAALSELVPRIDESFARAVEIIIQATTVLVAGIGKSGIIATKIAATLRSVNKPSHVLHPVEAMHGDLGMALPGSVAIVISKSGTTSEIIALLPYLKQRSIQVIGLIGTRDSYLSKNVDVCLDLSVAHEADEFNIVPTTSTTVALAMGDALAMGLLSVTGFSPTDFAHHHPMGQLGKNLQLRVRDVMHSGDEIPSISKEQSFKAALIVSSSKALGCVCVVDDQFVLQGIITDGDVRRVLQTHDDIRGLTVADVMTKQPVCANADWLLHETLAVMENRERQLSVLPVVDSAQHCIGVVRVHDIIRSTQA